MNSSDPFAKLAQRASAPGDHVLAALKAQMAPELEPKRALSRGERISLSVGALLLGLTLTSLRAASEKPQMLLLSGGAFCLSASALLTAGMVPGSRGRLSVGARRWILTLLLALCFMTLALSAQGFLSVSQAFTGEELAHSVKCASHSLLSGMVGAFALMFLWKRTDPFSPGLTGGLLGLLGGIVGTLSVGLLCAGTEGFHLTIGHGASALILTGLGIFVGRKWLSP